jgi:regulator of nucleoside diphosphate kinase
LADASVVPSDAVDDDVATINSRLVYVVDGYRRDSRVLVNCENDLAVGFNLPVTTLLGATLLGMRSGQRAALLREDGRVGHVLLKRVAYQPQATRKAISSATVKTQLLPQDRGSDLDKKIVRLDSKRVRENTTLGNSESGPDDIGPGPAAA